MQNSLKLLTSISIVILSMSSCTKTLYVGRSTQSHFSYPNSNVTPLNKVSGESTGKIKLLTPQFIDSGLMNEAYADAIGKASGADGLIEVDIYQKLTSILGWINITKVVVQGTAVKNEIGKQQLK